MGIPWDIEDPLRDDETNSEEDVGGWQEGDDEK